MGGDKGPTVEPSSPTKGTPGPAPSCPVDLHHSFWHVQRLLHIAVKKESPGKCPMAVMKSCVFFIPAMTNWLCTPPHLHIHPLATEACRVCFAPVCGECEGEGRECDCGAMDLRFVRGRHGGVQCRHARRGVCPSCGAQVKSASVLCKECGKSFLALPSKV